MASQLTDDLLVADRLIKRRYVRIPKDQQTLLDDNAWSETLSGGQHPMLNVPTNVLQDVKDLHMHKHAKSTQQPASSAKRPLTPNTAQLSPRPSSQALPTSSSQREGDEELPWSPSPVHHLRPQSDFQLHSPTPPEPSSPPRSPLKSKSPPQLISNEPQSSAVNSVGLEIEPPGCLTQVIEPPVNRTALRVITTASGKPEPTPPSAQLSLSTGERVPKSPPAKRRRVMEDTHNSGNDPESAGPVAATKPSQKASNSNQNSLTTATSVSSPSLSTQFARGGMIKSGQPKAMSDSAPFRSFTPTFEGRRRETAAQHLVVTGTPMPGPSFAPPPAQRNTTATAPSQTQVPSQQGSPSTSYKTFRLVYPDYSRTSRDFVIALLSVKQLKRDRAIHECLYDDFIRAYSSDYFAYVSECNRKQIHKPMPGIQWYNENVGLDDVLYTKNIVRKNNLADFLATHAEEAHFIRRALADSQSTESLVEDSDEDTEDALDQDEEHESEVIGLDQEPESQASPESHIESAEQVTHLSQIRDLPPVGKGESIETGSGVEVVELADIQMKDVACEENGQEALLEGDNGMRSLELHLESPNAAKATATLDDHHAAQSRKSPSLTSVKSFASQEDIRHFLSPSFSFSTRTSRVISSPARGEKQSQKAPTVSGPQRVERAVASKTSQSVLADDEDDKDEDASEPPIPLPTHLVATTSPSNRPGFIAADRDVDDDDVVAFRSTIQPPQCAPGPSSTGTPRCLSLDDEHNGGASGLPEAPAQRDRGPFSTSKRRKVAPKEDENDPFELPMLPLPPAVGPSPMSRDNAYPGDQEEDTDEDAFEPLAPKKVTRSAPAPKLTPRTSTAAAERRRQPSTMAAMKPSAFGQSSIIEPKKAECRVSKVSSVSLGAARRHSAGSSVASFANIARSKKLLSETPEQRSSRLKAFMEEQMEKKKKRLCSGTPGSTFASKG